MDDLDYARLKAQLAEQAIDADPDNLSLYDKWANLELRIAQLLGINY